VSVRLDVNNYSYKSYVMTNFLNGKMWGYVSVSRAYVIPRNTDEGYAALIDV
jgi:hypothetical protein